MRRGRENRAAPVGMTIAGCQALAQSTVENDRATEFAVLREGAEKGGGERLATELAEGPQRKWRQQSRSFQHRGRRVRREEKGEARCECGK